MENIGTTASIIAFCDGNRIITANVGDSSGVLLVKKTNIDPSDFVLQSSTIKVVHFCDCIVI